MKIRNFFNLAFMAIFVFSTQKVLGQTDGELRYPKGYADIKDVVKIYSKGSCGSETYDIGGGKFKIKYISKKVGDDNTYIIQIITNKANLKTSDNYADVDNQYCISKNDYDNQLDSKPPCNTCGEFGMLAVPFKLRFNPTTIAPGGELGGFYGWYIGNTKWLFATHAGLTSIALNDVNAETPDNKIGLTVGMALINDVSKSFQVGIVSGIDLFDGVENWAYKYNPWLSVQIGFKFTK
jgi:hypothetical protein